MNSLQRYTCKAAIIGLCLAAASGAYASVGSINSAIVFPTWNDVPGATRTYVNTFVNPNIGLISLNEAGVSGGGYANRDLWQFSNDGVTAYQFQNNDYFNASFNVTLTGNATTTDLEAGWFFPNPSGGFGGDLQLIVKNNGEIVQFGGPSFHGFSANDGGPLPNYVLGNTITLGLNYVLDPNTGMNAFQYSANGLYAESSPGNTYYDLGPGVGAGSIGGNPLGGYLQIQNDPTNPNNFGTAVFGDISIVPAPVPEPSALALLGLGIVPLLLRRRRI
jgi:hypothetical protein